MTKIQLWVPKGQPEVCRRCDRYIEYHDDDADGIWAECDCSAGYLS